MRERAETIVAGGPLGGAHFLAGDSTGTAQIVGIAGSQLSRSYPNVNWVVAVWQSDAELMAPFRLLGWYLLAVVAATVLAMFVAAIYVSMRLAAPQFAEDLHLVDHAQGVARG